MSSYFRLFDRRRIAEETTGWSLESEKMDLSKKETRGGKMKTVQ